MFTSPKIATAIAFKNVLGNFLAILGQSKNIRLLTFYIVKKFIFFKFILN